MLQRTDAGLGIVDHGLAGHPLLRLPAGRGHPLPPAWLATVACGLYLGRQTSTAYSSEARLESHAVWNTIDFILNGFVFILIGLQLPAVLPSMRPLNWPRMLAAAGLLSLLLIALRMVWMVPGSRLAHLIRQRVFKQEHTLPNRNQLIVLGWSGLRGVLTLGGRVVAARYNCERRSFPRIAT